MGYCTSYRLEVGSPSGVNKALVDQSLPGLLIARLRLNSECAEYALDEDGTCGESSKWYDHEDDMKKFSKENPGVLFTLHGEGEESGDVWTKYFFNGKMQVEKQPKWVPPPFDKSKLL